MPSAWIHAELYLVRDTCEHAIITLCETLLSIVVWVLVEQIAKRGQHHAERGAHKLCPTCRWRDVKKPQPFKVLCDLVLKASILDKRPLVNECICRS